MNKTLFAFLFFTSAILFAQEEQGIHAKIELITGAKQTVNFLSVNQDTVSLGGTIQGKFTVVKILRNRIKSIVDDQGNDLLNAHDTASDSTTNSVTDQDTLQNATEGDTIQGTIPEEFKQTRELTFLDSVAGKHVFVDLEHRSIDSSLSEELTRLSMRLLKEQGINLVFAKRTNFGYCREQTCIRDSLAAYGAIDVYQGNITGAKAQDTLTIRMTNTQLDNPSRTSRSATMNLSCFTSLSDAITGDKMNHFLKKLQGKKVETANKGSYIRVETDPEGANLEIKGSETLCKTPCTYSTPDTGKVEVYAYWSVDRHIWAAKSVVQLIPGDTNKISLRLKQVKPELFVTSSPEGAYIYAGSAPISKSDKPTGRTPSKFSLIEPGLSTVQLRKEGFKDTLVTVYAVPTGITNLDIQMEPIIDPAETLAQKEWLHERKKDFVGKTLMGSALAPVLLGTLFAYLANEDYDEARKIKNELSHPATTGGENYRKLVKKNHDRVDRGDRNMIIGGSLIGSGLLLFGIGFTLSF